MSDRAASLRAAAERKRADALARAETTLRDLHHAGLAITFQGVARKAGVSRQWLYQQPALRGEIERLRTAGRGRQSGVPATERASDASLRQRIATLAAENRRLRGENRALKDELAIAYGRQRDQRANP